MERFQLKAPYAPAGDQPKAIEGLVDGLAGGMRRQTLLGVTGSGKTFSMASVAAAANRPTLVLSPNKTLAAQLYEEFRALLPDNRVEYFVSYYDYYQPEAYIPQSDTYIDKETSINESIEQYRHSATQALAMRRDTLVVASVSCIYGLGDPEEYRAQHVFLQTGQEFGRTELLTRLVDILYDRNDVEPKPGQFRARGDTVDVSSPDGSHIWRVEFWGDTVDSLALIDPLKGSVIERLDELVIYPARHFITDPDEREAILRGIEEELAERLDELRRQNKLVEAQRLETRTLMDLEMIRELGYCNGIENYSRHFTRRKPGEPPFTLIDHFPEDFLCFIDESHVAVPQVRGMFKGDRTRKETLVDYGFRLPCALDNRPLKFEEFDARVRQAIFVSATPSAYELEVSERVVEQIVRPTGLVDPEVVVRPAHGQVDDLLAEIRKRVERGERVLATTLTKRMAEELTTYYHDAGVRVRYIHADVDTIERIELLEGLRRGDFDVLVGINLLREGLDLPEVSLVAILDADREGFLRNETSLIQTIGRAARNVRGNVILYADQETDSLRRALDETRRRRAIQEAYNREHGLRPASARSARASDAFPLPFGRAGSLGAVGQGIAADDSVELADEEREELVAVLERRMQEHARKLEFEEAAKLRDQVKRLRESRD